MKKFYYLSMAALALMATACSSDETVEMSPSSKQAIGFNAFVDKSVRADNDLTNTTLDAFNVYGFMEKPSAVIFNGTKVTGTVGDKTWTYSPEQYWVADKKYWFTAIAPADAAYTLAFPDPSSDTTPAYQGGGKITFDNSDASNNGLKDLIYAFAGGTGTDNTGVSRSTSDLAGTTVDPVNFTFNHLLSRVKFNFINGGNENTVLKITGLKITDAYKSGTIDKNTDNPSWVIDKDATDNTKDASFELSFAEQEITGNAQGDAAGNDGAGTTEDKCYMLPGQGSFTISFTAIMYAADGTTKLAEKEYTSTDVLTVTFQSDAVLEMEKSYVFTATITQQTLDENAKPIEFTVTETNGVTEWGGFGDATTIPTTTTEP